MTDFKNTIFLIESGVIVNLFSFLENVFALTPSLCERLVSTVKLAMFVGLAVDN